MPSWVSYTEPIEILNAEDVVNINNNISIISDLLKSKGYSVEELSNIVASTNTEYKDIFDILQNIEYNLDKINNNDAQSVYYGAPVKIGKYASNRDDIWRWIQVLNEMYDIVNGIVPKWAIIRCINGYPTIEEKKIVAKGDYIG